MWLFNTPEKYYVGNSRRAQHSARRYALVQQFKSSTTLCLKVCTCSTIRDEHNTLPEGYLSHPVTLIHHGVIVPSHRSDTLRCNLSYHVTLIHCIYQLYVWTIYYITLCYDLICYNTLRCDNLFKYLSNL